MYVFVFLLYYGHIFSPCIMVTRSYPCRNMLVSASLSDVDVLSMPMVLVAYIYHRLRTAASHPSRLFAVLVQHGGLNHVTLPSTLLSTSMSTTAHTYDQSSAESSYQFHATVIPLTVTKFIYIVACRRSCSKYSRATQKRASTRRESAIVMIITSA